MNPQHEDERIERYLLGDSTPDDIAHVEDRYFSDFAYLDRMDLLEEELLDRYLLGALDEGRKLLVEEHLLALPIQKQKAEFAATFLYSMVELATSNRKDSGSDYWIRFLKKLFTSRNLLLFGLPFFLLISIAGIGLLGFQLSLWPESNDQGNQPYAGNREMRSENVEMMTQPSVSPYPVVQTLFLRPALYARNEEEPHELLVNPGTELIEFRLLYDGPVYESYSIVIEGLEGGAQTLESIAVPSPNFKEDQSIKCVLRVSDLQSRSYTFLLRGAMLSTPPENLRRYFFYLRRP